MAGPVTIDWGDGTAVENGPEEGQVSHTYADPGPYTITVCDQGEPDVCTEVDVTLPLSPPMTLEAAEDTSDTTRMTVELLANNEGEGPVTIDWGDGTPTDANPGDGSTVSTHQYATADTYTITVTDDDDPDRTATEDVTVPFTGGDVPLTATEDTSDATRMTVELLADNAGQGDVTIDWGDGTATETNPGDNTTVSTHQYATAGDYTITATDTDDATRTGTTDVSVPFLHLALAEDTTDGTRMSVEAVVENEGNPVTIDWGDESPTDANAGDGVDVSIHQYATADTYTVTATDDANPQRTDTEDVTVPFAD